MNKKVYLIRNIEQYGKFIAYCIKHDIKVWRVYWNEHHNHCYCIDWEQKKCTYGSINYWDDKGYMILEPTFSFDEFGEIVMELG